MGRLNETLFFGILISLFFILIPAYYSSDYTNLLPLGELELGRLFRATLVTSYAYAGTEVLLVFYSQVSDPQRVMRAGLAATAITTVIYLIVTIACIMVFGSDGVVKYVWPGVTILKVANIAVVERLEFYFLAIWVGIVLRRVINRSFAAALSMAQLFRVEDRYGLAILGVGICSYIAALQIPNLAASRELISYAVWAYFFMGIIYPLLLLSISWIREGVVKQNA